MGGSEERDGDKETTATAEKESGSRYPHYSDNYAEIHLVLTGNSAIQLRTWLVHERVCAPQKPLWESPPFVWIEPLCQSPLH